MNKPSKANTLNKTDWKKIGKGALIALGGALLTYISQEIVTMDFGQWTPIVMAFWSVVVNIANKYVSGK